MATFGTILIILGLIALIGGHIWLIVAAFNTNTLWGFAVLLMPIASLAFLIKQWQRAVNPFFIQFIGLLVMLLGALLGGSARG
jgi:hypothetical protein